MKLSAKSMLLSVSAVSMPALAQETGAGFENFLLNSPSIVSPSQYYQVTGGRFEALAGLLNGSFDTKPAGTSADISGNALGAGYAQALNNQLVLGADVNYFSRKLEGSGFEFEDTETHIKPTVAFALSPIFSLGAAINIVSGSNDTPTDDESYSYNTFTVGGTLHQDMWEASLALTTKNKDDEKDDANVPQTLSLHGRYKVLPVLALGVRYDQADYPGIERTGETMETETSYGVIVESAFNEQSRVEVAFMSFANDGGEDGSDATRIFLSGGYDLAPNMELGAQIDMYSGESDTSEISLNQYALTFTSRN